MELLESLLNVLEALVQLLAALAQTVAPWWPLIAWIAFWTFAVDWGRLRPCLLRGGWVGVLLIGLLMVLVWGVVSPPPDGAHQLLGLRVSNFVGKTVYVTGLIVIMLLCGSVQLSGAVDRYLQLANDTQDADDEHAPGAHGGNSDAHAQHHH